MNEYDKRFYEELFEKLEARLKAIDNSLGCLVFLIALIALCVLLRICGI